MTSKIIIYRSLFGVFKSVFVELRLLKEEGESTQGELRGLLLFKVLNDLKQITQDETSKSVFILRNNQCFFTKLHFKMK